MCVIYSCHTAIPGEDELRCGSFRNDDGGGVAWLEKYKGKDQVFWKKGLMDHKAILAFIEKEKLALPLAIHFRTASAGEKCVELAHPFPLLPGIPLDAEGHADDVLFHNGHISNWEDLVLRAALGMDIQVPEGDWSDTRALAWLAFLKGPGILPFLSGSSRILLFSAEPNRWVDCDYDRSSDHFTHYGTWVSRAKEGWQQSVTTDWGGPVVTRGRGFRDYDTRDDEPTSCEALVARTAPQEPLNVWTVSELRDILEKLEKGLDDARIAAGV